MKTDNPTTKETPLHRCVRQTMESYFQQMGGHDCCNLYQLVITEVERPLLESVLREAGGNQTKASAMLGISRSTLRKKMLELGINE